GEPCGEHLAKSGPCDGRESRSKNRARLACGRRLRSRTIFWRPGVPKPRTAMSAPARWPFHRGFVAGGTALLAVGAVAAGVALAADLSRGAPRPRSSTVAADGLRHTSVEVSGSACGRGWSRPGPGQQVFDLRNSSAGAEEVYLTDARTGAVYGELEGLAPGT